MLALVINLTIIEDIDQDVEGLREMHKKLVLLKLEHCSSSADIVSSDHLVLYENVGKMILEEGADSIWKAVALPERPMLSTLTI